VVGAAVAALAASFAVPSAAHAIGGGKAVRSAPWSVQVYADGRIACSGSMLTDRWVITAAHCYQDKPGKMSVRVGDVRVGHGVKVSVAKMRWKDDVALFRLSRPVRTAHVTLARTDPPKGSVISIYGYGDWKKMKPLRKALNRVTAVKPDFIIGRAIWTKKIDGVDEPGDSGGPAFYCGKQVGVLFGPSEYSSIASHRGWIRQVTGV
jgi:hypothetical protein